MLTKFKSSTAKDAFPNLAVIVSVLLVATATREELQQLKLG